MTPVDAFRPTGDRPDLEWAIWRYIQNHHRAVKHPWVIRDLARAAKTAQHMVHRSWRQAQYQDGMIRYDAGLQGWKAASWCPTCRRPSFHECGFGYVDEEGHEHDTEVFWFCDACGALFGHGPEAAEIARTREHSRSV